MSNRTILSVVLAAMLMLSVTGCYTFSNAPQLLLRRPFIESYGSMQTSGGCGEILATGDIAGDNSRMVLPVNVSNPNSVKVDNLTLNLKITWPNEAHESSRFIIDESSSETSILFAVEADDTVTVLVTLPGACYAPSGQTPPFMLYGTGNGVPAIFRIYDKDNPSRFQPHPIPNCSLFWDGCYP